MITTVIHKIEQSPWVNGQRYSQPHTIEQVTNGGSGECTNGSIASMILWQQGLLPFYF